MNEGDDQSERGCKYIMIGCYTFPVTREGASLLPVPGREHEEEDKPLPGLEEEFDEMDHGGADVDQALPEEDELMEEAEDRNVKTAKSMHDTWHQLVEEAQNVTVKHLTFVEPIKSRNVKHVLPALSRIYARLKSFGLPVYRLHSDRAREFCSEQVRTWTLERDIVTTMTSGSSFKSNGRVEGEMNIVKKAIRTLISAGAATLQQWPLASRHIGERRLRLQLQRLGWPAGRLLRFGARAFALRKSWQARYAPWREVREEVKILGPDMNSSITSTSYFVESTANGRRFFTDDVVIPEAHQPAVEDQVLYLPERPDGVPQRRHRRKAPVQAISMLHIEGERVITERFPMMFEPLPGVEEGASSDSWTLGTDEASSASSNFSKEMDHDELLCTGGGDVEGVPNTWCGGSSPGTPGENQDQVLRAPVLRRLHCNVTEYIKEELQLVDATSLDQTLWMPTLTQAMIHRVALEDQLLDMADIAPVDEKVTEEFLVTKTISNKEVWDNLEDWEPSIKAEYQQLVTQKEAVRQMTKSDLHKLAEERGLPI